MPNDRINAIRRKKIVAVSLAKLIIVTLVKNIHEVGELSGFFYVQDELFREFSQLVEVNGKAFFLQEKRSCVCLFVIQI